ncbi:MAG: hypothetical protein K0S07_1554 [Chlamydiales bacterium]|jgi:hypothetical protein|nr:hypothetical protein [Chlamydiales bacterium]
MQIESLYHEDPSLIFARQVRRLDFLYKNSQGIADGSRLIKALKADFNAKDPYQPFFQQLEALWATEGSHKMLTLSKKRTYLKVAPFSFLAYHFRGKGQLEEIPMEVLETLFQRVPEEELSPYQSGALFKERLGPTLKLISPLTVWLKTLKKTQSPYLLSLLVNKIGQEGFFPKHLAKVEGRRPDQFPLPSFPFLEWLALLPSMEQGEKIVLALKAKSELQEDWNQRVLENLDAYAYFLEKNLTLSDYALNQAKSKLGAIFKALPFLKIDANAALNKRRSSECHLSLVLKKKQKRENPVSLLEISILLSKLLEETYFIDVMKGGASWMSAFLKLERANLASPLIQILHDKDISKGTSGQSLKAIHIELEKFSQPGEVLAGSLKATLTYYLLKTLAAQHLTLAKKILDSFDSDPQEVLALCQKYVGV